MIAGILAVVAAAGWIGFIAAVSRERKYVAERDEAEIKLTDCLVLNYNLSREVTRLKEEMNPNKL